MKRKQVEIYLAGVSNGLLKDGVGMCLEHCQPLCYAKACTRRAGLKDVSRSLQEAAEVRQSVRDDGEDKHRSCSIVYM